MGILWGQSPMDDVATQLWDKYVPAKGGADTIEGECIRAVGRLYYEWCNNGNCNAMDEPGVLDYYYELMVDFLRDHVPNIECELDNVVDMIVGPENCAYKYTPEDYATYNALAEKVIEWVVNREKEGFTKREIKTAS